MIVPSDKVTHWMMLVGMYEPWFYKHNPAPIVGPEFMFDFWIGAGYGWFIGGWEDYSPMPTWIQDNLLEWRIRYG